MSSTKESERKFAQADTLFREKRFPEVLELLDELDAGQPFTKNIMYPRALCLAALGRKEEALQVCESLEALFQDPRAHKLKQRIEDAEKAEHAIASPAAVGTRAKSASRVRSKSLRVPVIGAGIAVAVIAIVALAVFLIARFGNMMPGGQTPEGPKRELDPAVTAAQKEIDNAIRQHMASSAEPPFTSLFDTGSVSKQPLTSSELTSHTGWTEVTEGQTDHNFQGDAVLMNNQVFVVLRKEGTGAEICGRNTGFQKTYANLVPVGATSSAQRMDSLAVTQCGQDDVIVEATYGAGAVDALKVRYELAMGQVIVKVTPVEGVNRLRVEAPCRFAVLPDFFADDIVVDAREVLSDTAALPSENFLLHMRDDGDAIVMIVWNNRDQDVQIDTKGEVGSRQIQSSEVAFEKDGAVWVSLLADKGIWHTRDITADEKGKELPLNWKQPYPALWRVDWKRSDKLTDSWEMLTEAHDGTYVKHGLFEEEEDSWTAQDWWGSGTRTRLASGLGRFHYPCWVDRQGQGWLEPLRAESWGGYQALKGIPTFQGPALVYPLNRLTGTPLDKFTVVDLVRSSLGVGPCQYILDIEGQHEAFKGMPTCSVQEILDEIYEKGQQKERRAEVEKALDDVVAFIALIRGRIEEYRAFSADMQAFLHKSLEKSPELGPYVQEMQSLTGQIDAAIAEHTEGIKTVKYAADLAKEFRSEVLDYDGPGAAEKCKKYTAAWVEIGGNQDTLVAECRVAVKLLRQIPATSLTDNPQRSGLVSEVRSRTENILRAPVNYEAPRH